MVAFGKGQPAVGLYAAAQEQIAAGDQHQVAPENAVFDRSRAINRRVEAIIGSQRGEGRSRDENFHRRSRVEQLVGIERVEDLFRVGRVELHPPPSAPDLGPPQDLPNAVLQCRTPFSALRVALLGGDGADFTLRAVCRRRGSAGRVGMASSGGCDHANAQNRQPAASERRHHSPPSFFQGACAAEPFKAASRARGTAVTYYSRLRSLSVRSGLLLVNNWAWSTSRFSLPATAV